jgi:acid stress-induced BolA-like protein IbaG/YrbA
MSSDHPTDFKGDVFAAIREAVLAHLPDAQITVSSASGGHFELDVVSSAFAGKNMLQSQRLVLSSIAPLMKGERAPVHAIDTLKTRTP